MRYDRCGRRACVACRLVGSGGASIRATMGQRLHSKRMTTEAPCLRPSRASGNSLGQAGRGRRGGRQQRETTQHRLPPCIRADHARSSCADPRGPFRPLRSAQDGARRPSALGGAPQLAVEEVLQLALHPLELLL